MLGILPDFVIQNSKSDMPNGTAKNFIGSNQTDAYVFLGMDASTSANNLAIDNYGALSTLKFLARSSLHKNYVIIEQPTGEITGDDKLTIGFWFKPSDEFVDETYGTRVNEERSIIGTRPAAITDTDTGIKGFSFGISRNNSDNSTFNCHLNVNGEIIETNTGIAGIGTYGTWHYAIISIDGTLDYMGFSVIIPSGATFADTTTIYDIEDTAQTPGSILADLNPVILGADLYTPATDVVGRYYFDGEISNLTFYSSAPASTDPADVQTHFSNIAQKAWRLRTPEEFASMGIDDTVLSSFPLTAPVEVSPVIQDKNFGKRSFLANGFSGVIATDYSSDLPTNFVPLSSSSKSLVFNGSSYLQQRFYTPTTAATFEGELNTIFSTNYGIELWFKCTELPTLAKPRQYLLAKFQPGSAEVNEVEHGMYLALVKDSATGNVIVEYYNDQGEVAGVIGTRIWLQSGAYLSTIEEDTWYHVSITASHPDKPLDTAGTSNFSQTYLFVAKEPGFPITYEAFDEIDPAAKEGIGVASSDEFRTYPLTVGAGYLLQDIILDENPILNTSVLDVSGGVASTIDFQVNAEQYGVAIGDHVRVVTPAGDLFSDIDVTGVAGNIITFDHVATPLDDPNGDAYTVPGGPTPDDTTFGADYDGGTVIVYRDYPTTSPEYLGSNFIGKIVELRLWKKARSFGQLRSFRYKEL